MKKYLILCIMFCVVIVSGCNSTKSDVNEPTESHESYLKEKYEYVTLKIIDGAEIGNLILAGTEKNSVYTLDANSMNVLVNGKEAKAGDLEDGMPVDIYYNGDFNNTQKKQGIPVDITSFCKTIIGHSIGTKNNPGGTCYDLSGLYLKVLEDLWETDAGLNSDIKYISIDLSRAPGELTEGEKSAICYIFAKAHNKQCLELSYEELAKQGYLKGEKPYYFEDGILFSITDSMEEDEVYNGLRVIKFDAQKWRSGLGAYFFADCTASWPQQGTWSDYNVGAYAIS